MSTDIYRRLRELIPTQPVYIGQITLVHADKTASVTLTGGGLVRVANPGNLAQGKKVFVQEERITGEAPDLPLEQEVEI